MDKKDLDFIKRVNETLVVLFNIILKMEETALQESSQRNLSISEIHTLEAIGVGEARTMSVVAGILMVNVSTLSIAVNKLDKKGYVKRFRVEEDRRVVKIRLTEMGEAALKEHEEFHVQMVSAALQELSLEEREQLLQSLDNLRLFFESHRPE